MFKIWAGGSGEPDSVKFFSLFLFCFSIYNFISCESYCDNEMVKLWCLFNFDPLDSFRLGAGDAIWKKLSS